MSESSGNNSSERPDIDLEKRQSVKKLAYVPPAVSTIFLSGNLLAPGPRGRGSPPDPPIQPEDPMLLRLLSLLRLRQ